MNTNVKTTKLALHWKIMISMLLACGVGLATDVNDNVFGITFYSMYDFVGSIFINSLKMIIVPLVVSSIITGITKVGSTNSLGRMGGKTILFYLTSSLSAITVGIIIVNIISPGIVNGMPAGPLFGAAELEADKIASIGNRGLQDVIGIFYRMIPSNIIAAAAQGNMLGLIFFSVFTVICGHFFLRRGIFCILIFRRSIFTILAFGS